MNIKYKTIVLSSVAMLLLYSCNIESGGVDLTEIKNDQKKILKKLESIEKNQLGIKTSIAGINKPAGKNNNKKQQPQADPNKVYDIAIGDSYVMGNKDAPITIIEWTDFQ